MKKFLEEYGFAILTAIVVILLIAMATPVGNTVKNQIMHIVKRFGLSAERNPKIDNGNVSVILTDNPDLTITSPSSTDKFDYIVHYQEGGNEKQSLNPRNYEDGFVIKEKCDVGSEVYVEAIDEGTGEHYFSNTIIVPTKGFIVPSEPPVESPPAQEEQTQPQPPTSTSEVKLNKIVNFGGKDYVVLENKGDNKFLVMDVSSKIRNIINFDDKSNNYRYSKVEKYLADEYYNSLTPEIQRAICFSNITQDTYEQTINGYEKSNSSTEWEAHIFIPSIKEIEKLGVNLNDLVNQEFAEAIGYETVMLRDKLNINNSILVLAQNTLGTDTIQTDGLVILPTFTIDLSEISFTVGDDFIK